MKLSEAIMLGFGKIPFDPRFYLQNNYACLIGSGYYAVTGKTDASYKGEILPYWPWLEKSYITPPEWSRYGDMLAKPASIIGDAAYLILEGRISVERVVDWVASIEPPEAEEVIELQSLGELVEKVCR